MTTILSTTYCGPVQWYQKLYRSDLVLMECHETFQKQTYRNRCVIATTNGPQTLTVPVERGTSPFIRDIRISNHGNWRHQHWHALMSAYNESPFFDYYQDDFRPFFEKKYDFLYDFNMEICQKVCELIDIQPNIRQTEEYVKLRSVDDGKIINSLSNLSTELNDFRSSINPKHPVADAHFIPRRYYQVYERKHGFQPNLSIIDLLFNMGPESIFWL